MDKKIKKQTLLYGLGLVVLIVLLLLGVLFYGFGVRKFPVGNLVEFLHYPGVIMGNGNMISVSEIDNKLLAIESFYKNQDFSNLGLRVDFSTEEGKKRLEMKRKNLINKLIENRIIKELAKKDGLAISEDQASAELNRKLNEYGDVNYLKETVLKLYGWNIDDFRNNIVIPDLYRKALEENFKKNDSSYIEARKKMDEAKSALAAGGIFSEIAKQYSSGESSQSGGEMGWFSYDQMLPEIAVAVFSLDKGQTSEIIESSLGYHIINVEDRRKENDKDLIQIRQIFVRTNNFDEWLIERKKEEKIWIPIRGLEWNKNEGMVEFSDEDMRKFEEKELNDFSGDASVLF